jgi:TRAP-type C4-dicarboxylate transport system permease small subunit
MKKPADAPRPIELEIEEEPPVRLSDYAPEDYVALLFFWILAVVVFLQFFTRYVLRDSFAWTEEVARYLLICVTFLGMSMAVRNNSHVQVEFFYRWFPRPLARSLSTIVDLVRIVFFGICAWISWKLLRVMGTQQMASVDVSMGWMYTIVLAGFVVATLRAILLTWRHWRQGYSGVNPPAEADKAAPTATT